MSADTRRTVIIVIVGYLAVILLVALAEGWAAR